MTVQTYSGNGLTEKVSFKKRLENWLKGIRERVRRGSKTTQRRKVDRLASVATIVSLGTPQYRSEHLPPEPIAVKKGKKSR